MGYLNNTLITVDAILTKKGRELLARGDGSFKITQFALADDEIDYTLYNPNHPSGSRFYGEAIENLPILEAFPDENQSMKYKLTTLPRGTSVLPVLGGVPNPISLRQGETKSFNPQTLNYLGASSIIESSGYTVTVADARLLNSILGLGINTQEAERLNSITTFGTNVSKTVIGTSFNITGTTVNTLFGTRTQLSTTLTVIGRDSGARLNIPLTLSK